MKNKIFCFLVLMMTTMTGLAITFTFDRLASSLPITRAHEIQQRKGASALPQNSTVFGQWEHQNVVQVGSYLKQSRTGTVQWRELSFNSTTLNRDCNPETVNGRPIECPTPLLLDLSHNGFNLTAPNEGVYFDFDGGGEKTHTHWVMPTTDDAFLAIDLNSNGVLDDGTELFGDSTVIVNSNQSAADGYEALAQYDSNVDGKITKKDAIWDELLLWNDFNGNGISESSEISFVKDNGLKKFKLKVKTNEDNIDVNGSLLQDWSWVKTDNSFNPMRVKMVDVYFSPISGN